MDGFEMIRFNESKYGPYDVDYDHRVHCSDGLDRWVVHHEGGATLLWAGDSQSGEVLGFTVYHTPMYNINTGECWCKNCHSEMHEEEPEWVCPECGTAYLIEDGLDCGTPWKGAPSKEASYDYETIPYDGEWCYANHD